MKLNQHMTVSRASAGTGKTYTLAANYVGLLLSGESYRSILAVTFTNKATMEMKDRILLFLDNIARNTGAEADNALKAVRERMIDHLDYSVEKLRQRAAECYRQMLGDYDNIHISTIDTFLLQLMNGLGQMLADSSAGATVELDVERIITKAVDNLLTGDKISEINMTRFQKYVRQQLEEGKSWDIRSNLIALAKEMFSESIQQLEAQGLVKFDVSVIDNYRQHMNYRCAPCFKALCVEYEKWRNYATKDKDLVKFIDEIGSYIDGTCQAKYMFRGVGDLVKYNRLAGEYELVRRMDKLSQECCRVYKTQELTGKKLYDMSLMSALREEIRSIMVEENSLLLAQTANTLHRAMATGDADFILEKAGIRYRHIMLDEFQDTSVLQWENFKPLLEEILANGGTVFIVGDIKQSIYRWRNGDWRIMNNLNEQTPVLGAYYQPMPLTRNFRSSSEIVQFNLSLFQKLTSDGFEVDYQSLYEEGYIPAKDGKPSNLDQFYRKGNTGGYVQLQFVPYETDLFPKREDVQAHLLREMFTDIESRLSAGVPASQMFILVHTHQEADEVVKYFQTQCAQLPVLSQTNLVSCESFKFESSASVLLLIHAMRWIVLGDAVSEHYVKWNYPNFDVEQCATLKASFPLCELVEELIKLLPSHQYSDIAYINGFADGVHKYAKRNGSDAKAFLTYWNDKMHAEPIAVQTADAIQIMTIHVAKGLEAPYVFIPFCNWTMDKFKNKSTLWFEAKAEMDSVPVEPIGYVPVSIVNDTYKSAYEADLLAEQRQMRLDSLNMLYVALTRAGKALYIYGAMTDKQKEDNSTVAALIYNALPGWLKVLPDTFSLQFGALPAVTTKKAATSGQMEDRFSFAGASTQPAQLHVGDRPISFRMSRETMASLIYGSDAKDERQEHINLGNVCHSIFEHMLTREDQATAIADARCQGLIESDEAEQGITQLIDNAWTNEQMCDWFSGRWEVLRETTFIMDNEEHRPDRIMIDRATSSAVVLDYKFGEHEDSYAWQVRRYMKILRQLNYKNVSGYLWYAQDSELEQIQ